MAIRREEVNDPVQRLVGVVGVQGGQAEVAGLGERDGVVHHLAAAHLADQNHVRRLAQGVLQRHLEGFRVDAHFPLRDDAALVLVDEFDRVLDGDDVPFGVLVAVADHRRQRGGFTGAGGADENHQAALGHRQVLDHRRQAQLVHVGNLGLDAAQHHAHQVALVKGAGPEPADAAGGNREVALVVFEEFLALLFVHGAEHDVPGHVRGQGVARHRQHLAVNFHARRHAGGDEQVRAAFLHH